MTTEERLARLEIEIPRQGVMEQKISLLKQEVKTLRSLLSEIITLLLDSEKND